MTRALEHRDVRELSEDDWLQALTRAVHEPVQDGLHYPGFPEEHIQRWFVGSAYGDALDEGFRFFRFVRAQSQKLSRRCKAARYLDFGCGWGRIGRFFLHDFERGDMAGVDIDPQMVHFCRGSDQPGDYLSVQNDIPLPFADRSFKLVTAYSVFTHLPAHLFEHWLQELLRVTAPQGLIVFTVEPPRFLDFVAAIDEAAPESGWHLALKTNLGEPEARRQELATRGITYLPTGGGGTHRQADVYGDTVVTPEYIVSAAGRGARLRAYIDDPSLFWQAVAVVQRVR